jgi:hypothetical protein
MYNDTITLIEEMERLKKDQERQQSVVRDCGSVLKDWLPGITMLKSCKWSPVSNKSGPLRAVFSVAMTGFEPVTNGL